MAMMLRMIDPKKIRPLMAKNDPRRRMFCMLSVSDCLEEAKSGCYRRTLSRECDRRDIRREIRQFYDPLRFSAFPGGLARQGETRKRSNQQAKAKIR